jgi:transcriptional regulator GlxA family with amidase domain
MKHWSALLMLALLAACQSHPSVTDQMPPQPPVAPKGVLQAGFVVRAGVYNSELMAPYDVFHHSIFRDSLHYIRPFIVSADGQPVATFEGITLHPHYRFDNAPPLDILVIPSTVGSMEADVQDAAFMAWLKQAVAQARYVVTVCDGAFPLAATGVLDGRTATTFPADRAALAARFPAIQVVDTARLVVDGKYITSVGGAMSYEPAFYLVEYLYGKAHADQTAEGLVWDWNLAAVPRHIAATEHP